MTVCDRAAEDDCVRDLDAQHPIGNKDKGRGPQAPLCTLIFANGQQVEALADSGAYRMCLSGRIFRMMPREIRAQLKPPPEEPPHSASGHAMSPLGTVELEFRLVNCPRPFRMEFLVIEGLSHDALLGYDAMVEYDMSLCPQQNVMLVAWKYAVPLVPNRRNGEPVASILLHVTGGTKPPEHVFLAEETTLQDERRRKSTPVVERETDAIEEFYRQIMDGGGHRHKRPRDESARHIESTDFENAAKRSKPNLRPRQESRTHVAAFNPAHDLHHALSYAPPIPKSEIARKQNEDPLFGKSIDYLWDPASEAPPNFDVSVTNAAVELGANGELDPVVRRESASDLHQIRGGGNVLADENAAHHISGTRANRKRAMREGALDAKTTPVCLGPPRSQRRQELSRHRNRYRSANRKRQHPQRTKSERAAAAGYKRIPNVANHDFSPGEAVMLPCTRIPSFVDKTSIPCWENKFTIIKRPSQNTIGIRNEHKGETRRVKLDRRGRLQRSPSARSDLNGRRKGTPGVFQDETFPLDRGRRRVLRSRQQQCSTFDAVNTRGV